MNIIKPITKTVGVKNDDGKTRYDLVLPEFEEGVAKVLTFGADKYEANNWMNVEDPKNRYYAAVRRHLAAWRKGELIDEESGLPHLAHVATNIMFLQHFDEEK